MIRPAEFDRLMRDLGHARRDLESAEAEALDPQLREVSDARAAFEKAGGAVHSILHASDDGVALAISVARTLVAEAKAMSAAAKGIAAKARAARHVVRDIRKQIERKRDPDSGGSA